MTSPLQRLEPRMQSILERIAVQDSVSKNPYLINYTPDANPAYVWDGERKLLMMSSYSYLGLAGDPRIVDAAIDAVREFGTGTHGVRLLCGSTPSHRALENTIARLKGTEDAIVYSSGYAANVGTISALCGPRDDIFIDKDDHASIVDGCRQSGATIHRFHHNDVSAIEAALSASQAKRGVRLVVVDGVYSMDGDIAPLREISALCRRFDALLMVDEAHSMGLIGPNGRGVDDHFGDSSLVDIKMGTLSKAIPSVGGYVAGSARLIKFLKHVARPFIFSASLPPGQAAAANAALEIMQAEPWRALKAMRLGALLRGQLQQAGFNTGRSETAIIPLLVSSDVNAFNLSAAVRELGVVATPVVAPAVAPGAARLRVTVTGAHSEDDVVRAAAAFIAGGKACGMI